MYIYRREEDEEEPGGFWQQISGTWWFSQIRYIDINKIKKKKNIYIYIYR